MLHDNAGLILALALGAAVVGLPLALLTQGLTQAFAGFGPTFGSCYAAFGASVLICGVIWTALMGAGLVTDKTANAAFLGLTLVQVPVFAKVVRGTGGQHLGLGPALGVCVVQTVALALVLFALVATTAQYWFFT